MRARTVNNRAYIFDFDDTLVKTDAKIHIYKDGKRIKSLTPEEYNTYEFEEGETQDLSDFVDPRIILRARPYKMWPALKNIDIARKSGRSTSDIFILTARSPGARVPIHNFLSRDGIDIPLQNVITVGFDDGRPHNISKAKEIELEKIRDRYDEVVFFDDSEKNIKLASKIDGVKTRLVDSDGNKANMDKVIKEEIGFERGKDPKDILGIGLYQKVFNETSKNFNDGGAYSFNKYGPKNWKDIILWMKDEGYTPAEVEQVLRSKLMRWAAEDADQTGNVTLEDFQNFNIDYIDSFLEKYGPYIYEDAGAPAAFTGGGSNPGMGNAQPASTAAMTGSQQSGDSAIGSGDNWDSSIGPTHTQDKSSKIKKESVNEMNISPHDKLGVAMAQKMGIPLAFKKGKGDKDVEQKEIDEDNDMSTEIVTFEEWAKKFIGEK